MELVLAISDGRPPNANRQPLLDGYFAQSTVGTAVQYLVLTDPNCVLPDFPCVPWDDAILITPQNSVQTYWDEAASTKHGRSSGNIKYLFCAEDYVHHRQLSTVKRFAVASLSFDDTDRLLTQLTVSLLMKAMVTKNIYTCAGVANGSRGTIAGIMLDKRETWFEATTNQGSISLMFPPAVSVMPDIQRLSRGLVTMFPDPGSFTIRTSTCAEVQWHQFTLTPAYAFTNLKSQGQAIERVMVDLGSSQ
ncbi:hypothetical protein DFJ58DRAFT_663500 [Suillus subalutaceus]|uniref:uncharacterized protein n=1 Tax=Suillus subalutaceus TaxID=48586 RepID=UPI001B87ED56|nr:uncharacterized protein DFJ58DRAFT_663500 [Suillus subalutaceus]KAG1846990.1 hypothetical protein DFJ58DRAFT_663500 [Suillus subalutaceus]